MALRNYGVLAGKLVNHGPQPGGNPHYLLFIQAGFTQFRVAINLESTESDDEVPPELQYQQIDLSAQTSKGAKALAKLSNFNDFILKANDTITLPDGSELDPLDFVRDGILDMADFATLPRGSSAQQSAFHDDLVKLASSTVDDADGFVVVFGTGYPDQDDRGRGGGAASRDPRRSTMGFTGMDNVHMNQGSYLTLDGMANTHAKENGPNQDGAVLFFVGGSVTGFFSKFQSQDTETDDQGEPIHTGVPDLDAVPQAVQAKVASLHPEIQKLRRVVRQKKSAAQSADLKPGVGSIQRDLNTAVTLGEGNVDATPALNGPSGFVFADDNPLADPNQPFKQDIDGNTYKSPYVLNFSSKGVPEPVPSPRGNQYPVMKLESVLGTAAVGAIRDRIVFHCCGDSGAPLASKFPHEQAVADLMIKDFSRPAIVDQPKFFFHLGDVVYFYGEADYYYNQFYEPFMGYPAPIFAIPGNHDGLTYNSDMISLDGFTKAFCDDAPSHWKAAGGIARTTMTQPGVYFTLDCPLVSIIGLYSNCDEQYGYIDQQQKLFFYKELQRLGPLRKNGEISAIVLAVHHPPLSVSSKPSSSIMRDDLDKACTEAGFWPDAVVSGHTHLYQRATRMVKVGNASWQIPYLTIGSAGYDAKTPRTSSSPAKTPAHPRSSRKGGASAGGATSVDMRFDQLLGNYGFSRITIDQGGGGVHPTLQLEFLSPDINGGINPADRFVLDLNTHQVSG